MKAQTILDNTPRHARAAPSASLPARVRIRLWDLPLRLFHWLLVLAVTLALITGELGGPWMELHGKAGLGIVGLVVFRLVWGVIGSAHARFLSFLPTPSKLKAYLGGRWRGVGHNPLGALSVIALLGLLAAQAGTGLFSNDDIAFSGPLFALVDEALAGRLTSLHKQLATVLFGLLALHLAAIAFYAWFKHDNLVKPMVTGWKEVEPNQAPPAAHQNASGRKGGAIAFALALAVAVAVVYGVSGAALPGSPAAAAEPATATQGQPGW
ncbi:cytochrome b/b6 domain-containing protein [Polaromonas naphthalenivorans]|uniref:Cytochrome B561 n=1 Tax=Polaromonas naphthalenivorans (strain CJ2) TaxID=365044 RepID=A1VJT2_POLNA|nr:cytochrome b/b6 domain-containing protein [Polaromonas naphthalenivorans]ABM35910.1 cytochrome B561 [Polaromonas naphthalenivorans CJ2]